MKHWTPRIGDAVEAALAGGAETIVGLVLAPHYSRMSIGGYRAQVEEALDARAELLFVERWHDEPALVELWAERLRGTQAHVVFTAHSLPARILDEGDPYQDAAARDRDGSSLEAAGLSDWSFSFQSESADRRALARPRHPRPPRGAPRAGHAARPRLRRSASSPTTSRSVGTSTPRRGRRPRSSACGWSALEMPNDDPAFVAVLVGIVRRALSAVGSTEAHK